jgi:hypothetical protein
MGNASSSTIDSVSTESNKIIEKIKHDKKHLEEFIKNRKTKATDQWSEEKNNEDIEQNRLTTELVGLKKRLTELNKEFDKLQAASNQQEYIASDFNLPISQGGTKKKKNSKRKNSKRKNSKRKNSKRK